MLEKMWRKVNSYPPLLESCYREECDVSSEKNHLKIDLPCDLDVSLLKIKQK
jgi:hypothetical protein